MLRAEYITGDQTATQKSAASPGSYPLEGNVKVPYLARPFDGAYFYFVQNIANEHNQFILKYDWFDPNTRVAGNEIDAISGFTDADIKYNTFGFGFLRHINEHLKLVLWYDSIRNESTQLDGFRGMWMMIFLL